MLGQRLTLYYKKYLNLLKKNNCTASPGLSAPNPVASKPVVSKPSASVVPVITPCAGGGRKLTVRTRKPIGGSDNQIMFVRRSFFCS